MNTPHMHFERKDPGIAVLLSFLWTGAGQVYAGDINRGITLIVISFFFLLLSLASGGLLLCFLLPYWIWGMFDASAQARKHNDLHGPR